MDVALTILGAAIIVVGFYDMVLTLLHASRQGLLSNRVLAGMWKISKAARHGPGSTVGPAGMITVVSLWVLLQSLGWALIYYPHVSGGFAYSPGVDPADYPDFLEALYFSFSTLATLGFGDIVPTDPGVRVAALLQAFTGLGLFTAALAWFMQIRAPMSRRRMLALKLKLMADIGLAEEIRLLTADTASRTLDTLAVEVDKVRIDFTQHTEGFYFREPDPKISLARQLPYALQLREAASASPVPAVQLSAQRLGEALEQLAQKIKTGFLRTGNDTKEILTAYAHEDGRTTP